MIIYKEFAFIVVFMIKIEKKEYKSNITSIIYLALESKKCHYTIFCLEGSYRQVLSHLPF